MPNPIACPNLLIRKTVRVNSPAQSSEADLTDILHYTIMVVIKQQGSGSVSGKVRHEASVGNVTDSGSDDWIDIEAFTFSETTTLKIDVSNVGFYKCRVTVELTSGQVKASALIFGKDN